MLKKSEVLYYSVEKKGNISSQLKHYNPWSMKCHQQQLQRMKENAKHRNQYSILCHKVFLPWGKWRAARGGSKRELGNWLLYNSRSLCTCTGLEPGLQVSATTPAWCVLFWGVAVYSSAHAPQHMWGQMTTSRSPFSPSTKRFQKLNSLSCLMGLFGFMLAVINFHIRVVPKITLGQWVLPPPLWIEAASESKERSTTGPWEPCEEAILYHMGFSLGISVPVHQSAVQTTKLSFPGLRLCLFCAVLGV